MEGPESLTSERDELLKEIYEAFAHVTRAGGVSWSEAEAMDIYASEEECAAARARDTEPGWGNLVTDASWKPIGTVAFCYLDPIGFRYYLAAAMARSVRYGQDAGIQFQLTIPDQKSIETKLRLPDGRVVAESSVSASDMRAHRLLSWSLLTREQTRCVARFLRFMISLEASEGNESERRYWQQAYDSYWSQTPPR